VAYSEHRELEKNVVNFEPHAALFSRDNGLFHIKALLDKAPDIMLPGGMLLCETGWNQGKAVKDAALSAGTFKDVSIIRDYAGHDRLLKAQTSQQKRHVINP
jgi:release factor glutamine methyltransferase